MNRGPTNNITLHDDIPHSLRSFIEVLLNGVSTDNPDNIAPAYPREVSEKRVLVPKGVTAAGGMRCAKAEEA
jgi:hypothetical protein